MTIVYVVMVAFLLVLSVLIVPIRLSIKYETKTKKVNGKESAENYTYMQIYILYFIKIKKIEIDEKNKIRGKGKNSLQEIYSTIIYYKKLIKEYEIKNRKFISSKDLKKLNNSLYFEKVNLELNINFFDYIINAYLISFLNTAINIYIALNYNKFDITKFGYKTNISDDILDMKADVVVRVTLIKILLIILKIIPRLIKGKIMEKKHVQDMQVKV